MKISELGGEFALIKRLMRNQGVDDKGIYKGIGDDCAVLFYEEDKYQLATTDMIVEGDHFNLKWQTPYQVGVKLVEANVSDIVSMGGYPRYALLSMSLGDDTSVEFMDEFYRGLFDSARRHGVVFIGGDTTHGPRMVFNLALLGEVEKKLLRLRSMAQIGDIICVTGSLGGSSAGLNLLQSAKGDKYTKEYLEPQSRTAKEAMAIALYAHAMIDVSDGLASEVNHICDESLAGATLDADSIPLSPAALYAAKELSLDAVDMALYGGEDFEIVFTIPKDDLKLLYKEFSDFTIVGTIEDEKKGRHLLIDNKLLELKGGYDHFL